MTTREEPRASGARPGDLVDAREAVWRVTRVRAGTDAVRVVSLRGADAANRWQACTLLEPFDRVTPRPVARAPRRVSRRRWMRAFRALVASSTAASDGLDALTDANVSLLPHQLEPLLAILTGLATRVLIADDVGLGKTIEAALVLRVLVARGQAARVLIVVPAGLRDQWRRELRDRVGLASTVIDAASLTARVRHLPPDLNPWAQPGLVITSLDFIKQEPVLHGVAPIAWDVLVIDEAHALTSGTDRATAATLLARHSHIVLLLTATPHDGDDQQFDALCHIGHLDPPGAVEASPAEANAESDIEANAAIDRIAVFRRTRETLGLPSARRVHVLRVRPTAAEGHLHDLLTRYTMRVERDHPADAPAALAMSVLRKRVASSPWSLLRSLERRRALLSATTSEPLVTQPPLPFAAAPEDAARDAADGDGAQPAAEDPAREDAARADAAREDAADAEDAEPLGLLAAPGLASAANERAWLSLLIEAARRAVYRESKLRALERLLRRIGEPAIVYTEYRDTLTHLLAALPSATRIATLHGAMPRSARDESLRRFATGDATLLLATDAAAEGLNLQHHCRLVINIELPWNPNRLEQRLGRVDRLGQTRTVHAIHLVAPGAGEETLLHSLQTRLARIRKSLSHARETTPTSTVTTAIATAIPNAAGTATATPTTAGTATAGTATAVAANTLRLWPDLRESATECVRRLESQRTLRPPTPTDRANRARLECQLDSRAPWIATTRRRHRTHGPLATFSPGVLYVWRTRLHRLPIAHEFLTPLLLPGFFLTPRLLPGLLLTPLLPDRVARATSAAGGPRSRPGRSDGLCLADSLSDAASEEMLRRLDALARSAMDAEEARERRFGERLRVRQRAIRADIRGLADSRHLERQAGLFREIDVEREASQGRRWTMARDPEQMQAGAGPAVTAVEHSLLLVLVLG